jgi:hypothetical protein
MTILTPKSRCVQFQSTAYFSLKSRVLDICAFDLIFDFIASNKKKTTTRIVQQMIIT